MLFEPLDFISRLAALVARPRALLVRYHGVFAPNAKHRRHIMVSVSPTTPCVDEQLEAPPTKSRVAMSRMQRRTDCAQRAVVALACHGAGDVSRGQLPLSVCSPCGCQPSPTRCTHAVAGPAQPPSTRPVVAHGYVLTMAFCLFEFPIFSDPQMVGVLNP